MGSFDPESTGSVTFVPVGPVGHFGWLGKGIMVYRNPGKRKKRRGGRA
jgi:hypothetical protein